MLSLSTRVLRIFVKLVMIATEVFCAEVFVPAATLFQICFCDLVFCLQFMVIKNLLRVKQLGK